MLYWSLKIESPWWRVAGSPDLGRYTTDRQQPVDFAIWQAADGTWQIWSCIRSTSYPGWTRLFYRWEAKSPTDHDWKPMGIVMTSDTQLGEVEGMLQAPYVIRTGGHYVMFYGTGDHIAVATSKDGKEFQRRISPDGTVGIFSDGFGTRDPMTIKVGGIFYTYYSANPGTVFNTDDASAANRSTLHMAANADLVSNLAGSCALEHCQSRRPGRGGRTGALFGRMPFRLLRPEVPLLLSLPDAALRQECRNPCLPLQRPGELRRPGRPHSGRNPSRGGARNL